MGKYLARALSELREEPFCHPSPSSSCLINGDGGTYSQQGAVLQVNRLGVLQSWKGTGDRIDKGAVPLKDRQKTVSIEDNPKTQVH